MLAVLLALLAPSSARAGKNSMIPPGQEQRIRALVDEAIAATRAAGELPVEIEETVDIHIDRDRIRVLVRPRTTSPSAALVWLVVFHPDAVPEDVVGALAPGVVLRCGAPGTPRDCTPDEAAPWGPLAGRIAEARAPVADQIWQVEEQPVVARAEDSGPAPRSMVWADRGAAIGAALLGLGLAVFGASTRRDGPGAIRWSELCALALLLALFVGATLKFTVLLPLHEHNSFIARSDCAVEPRCTEDPAGAWNMTTMHVYGLVLSSLPYRASVLSAVSLVSSVVVLILLWALARVLMRALGRPELGAVAGLSAVAVLATHPVAWRLAGSATFWPWVIAWTFGAALAGLWASSACADEDRRTRIAGALAWIVAATCLAVACGGNFVLLTLGVGLGLGPLCWTRAWAGETSWRAALLRLVIVGVPALGMFALVATQDYFAGYARAFAESGLDDSVRVGAMIRELNPLLLDRRISALVWAGPLVLALAWLWPSAGARRAWLDPLRTLLPLVYLWLVPAAFLGLAAAEVVGSGYPVGFINHHWELCFTALGAGLGVAWLVAELERRRPLDQLLGGRAPAWLSWSRAVPSALALLALGLGPRADEGWRFATGERVLERELVALEAAFAELPEHDVLIVPPRVLEPTTDAPSQWDPLEVVFPAGFYAHAMRERGLEPARVVSLDRMTELELRPGARVLLYLGSSLRSYQPHEIEAGAVDDGLERPPLLRVHDDWEFERAREFVVATAQHEAISQRLGADRQAEVELGFFWLRPR
ncbi:hypothetical protein ENSA5_45710 [Enhygromyxa salina]|uniref:Glycosyltransferase RgtA/B/C/D-like domain-containing protein n=1 Tax=Enhygromyxa salina TaxID=215803 RepID=A0A2S9XJL8_9BACT|nr:hypothetical protein ENSA5_45710 [Enhygromyxa salina]